jgi:hypothetical protein
MESMSDHAYVILGQAETSKHELRYACATSRK